MNLRSNSIFIFLFLLQCYSTLKAQNHYGNTIYTNVKIEKSFKDALEDFKYHLQKITKQSFTIQPDSNHTSGIIILKLSTADTAAYPLLYANKEEAFTIQSDGNTSLKILAFSPSALIHGMYTYLDTLGVKWYFPGNEYTYIPNIKSIKININQTFIPHFTLRSYFGTFGTPRNAVIDKSKQVNNEWLLWNKRNRLGGSFALKGHSWNDFMWKNGRVLIDSPQYMALYKGTRAKVATASKFCISNIGLQNLYVAHHVKLLQEQIKKSPNAPRYIISVEPSDGAGFCTCSNCKAVGSISNNVFTLANLTAKAFKKIAPNAYVNLYAYNLHASPPSFDLEDNVIVQIIPYKYQQYAKPEVMIKEWQAKTSNLFIYDYFGLPLTTFDTPLKGWQVPSQYLNRVRYWSKNNIKGISLESSYSTGATGLGIFLFSKYAWNTNCNISSLQDEFFKNCFGKNADVIKQSQQLLADKSYKEAALAIQNIKSPKDSLQQSYLVNYKAYLLYLHLLKQYQNKPSDANADSLMQFVYGTFFRKIINNFPISDYMLNQSKSAAYIKRYWNCYKATQKENKFNTVTQLTDQDINSRFKEMISSLL